MLVSYIRTTPPPQYVCVYIYTVPTPCWCSSLAYIGRGTFRLYSSQGSEVRALQDGRQLRASKDLQRHQRSLQITHTFIFTPPPPGLRQGRVHLPFFNLSIFLLAEHQITGSKQTRPEPVWSHSGVNKAEQRRLTGSNGNDITSCSCLLSTGPEDIGLGVSLQTGRNHSRTGHEDMRTFLYCDKEISNAIRILYICIIHFRYVVSHVQR